MLKKKEYILYLRGFNSDTYEEECYARNFSEFEFVKAFGDEISFFAVGNPSELTKALGCQRVYLKNDTWSVDVQLLMQNAKHIVILVDNRKSCIQEIIFSILFKNKTTYIVDDVYKYQQVQKSINLSNTSSISFPTIDEIYKKSKVEGFQYDENLLYQAYENQLCRLMITSDDLSFEQFKYFFCKQKDLLVFNLNGKCQVITHKEQSQKYNIIVDFITGGVHSIRGFLRSIIYLPTHCPRWFRIIALLFLLFHSFSYLYRGERYSILETSLCFLIILFAVLFMLILYTDKGYDWREKYLGY